MIPSRHIDRISVAERHLEPVLQIRQLGSAQQSFPVTVNALEVMQSEFWAGSNWPLGIDWTEAVFNTNECAALNSITRYAEPNTSVTVNKYYSQLLNFFDGENVAAVMNEKYDDMQWVVLEWLEAIKFLSVYENSSQNQRVCSPFPKSLGCHFSGLEHDNLRGRNGMDFDTPAI